MPTKRLRGSSRRITSHRSSQWSTYSERRSKPAASGFEFDAHVGRLLGVLRETGRLDNAMVVIYSDHGMKYETTSRVPLVIRFPRGEHRGSVVENAQGIDIAPTILDYIGVGKPAWMSGASLLRPLDSCRPILGIRSDPKDHRLEDGLWQAAGGAGAARIGSVSVVVCDRLLVAKRDGNTEGRVRGHEGSCDACAPDPKAMHAHALDLLATRPQAVAAPAALPPPSSEADAKGTSIAVFRPAEHSFRLIRSVAARNDVLRYPAGEFEDLPVAGDWDGNGRDELGLYRPSTSTFYLFPANDQPDAATVIPFGMPGDVPLSGDWDGDGVYSVGVFRPSSATFHLRDDDSDESVAVTFGTPEDLPVVGDWNGDGTWTIGVFRPSSAMFYLRDANETGMADRSIAFGTADDVPMVGDWNGDQKTDLGVFRASLSVFFLSTRGGGIADITVQYGAPGDRPVVGRW